MIKSEEEMRDDGIEEVLFDIKDRLGQLADKVALGFKLTLSHEGDNYAALKAEVVRASMADFELAPKIDRLLDNTGWTQDRVLALCQQMDAFSEDSFERAQAHAKFASRVETQLDTIRAHATHDSSKINELTKTINKLIDILRTGAESQGDEALLVNNNLGDLDKQARSHLRWMISLAVVNGFAIVLFATMWIMGVTQ